MTTSASLPPTNDVVAPTSLTRTRTSAGDSNVRDAELARAQVAAMQASAMAGVIDAMPAQSARAPSSVSRRDEAQPPARAERVPDSGRSDPTDPATARARAAEAELRVETATYQGVRDVIAATGSSAAADRAAQRRSTQRETAPAEAAATDEPDDKRRRELRAERERTAEQVALARIEQSRAGLVAIAEAEREAAAEDVARANELAEVVAQENARLRAEKPSREEDPRASAAQPTEAAANALRELAARVGALSERLADGRIQVSVGDRALVDRGGAHPLALRSVPVASEQGADPRSTESDGEPELAHAQTRLEVAWPNRREADGVGGSLAGHLSAVNTLVPQASLVVEEIAVVASAEAALAAATPSGAAPSASGDIPDVAGQNTETGRGGPVAPTPAIAGELLDELGASLQAAATESARDQDIASAVAAITAGPPAAYYASVVVSAGEAVPAGVAQVTARASQQLVTDLQHLTDLVETAQHSATGLAVNTPFVPVSVTSSAPDLVRVDTPWPSAGLLSLGDPAHAPAIPGETAAASAGGAPAAAGMFDPDAIVSPQHLQLSVVSVAHGDIVVSRTGVPEGLDLAGGNPVSLVLGTVGPATAPGDAAAGGRVVGEVVVPAPVTIDAVAEAINSVAHETGSGLSAGVQQGSDGLAHLIVESEGAAWVASRRDDGTSRDILGGFSSLAPRTDSVVVSTTAGLGWTGISADRSIEGPLAGLGLTLAPGSEGRQVTLTVTPAVDEVVDAVGELVDSVRGVLGAAGAVDPFDESTGLLAGAGESEANGMSGAATAGTSPDAVGADDRADDALTAAGDDSSQAPSVVPAAPQPAPTPLAGDPAIMNLAAAFAAAISGAPGAGMMASGGSGALAAGSSGALLAAAGAAGIPGLSVEAVESGRRRLAFDREMFARALADEPSGTRSAVRAAASEVATVAREALDGRVGLLAVRLHTELTAVREVDIQSASPEWDKEQREIEATRRADALTALLDRLDAEADWLGGHLS